MRFKICILPLVIALLLMLAGCAQTNKAIDDFQEAVTPQKAEDKPLPKPAPSSYFVQAWQLNLRHCPGIKCHIISVLKRGQEVTAGEQKGGWIKVTPAGRQNAGWVAMRYLGTDRPKIRVKRSNEDTGPAPEPPPPSEELAPVDPRPPTVEGELAK